MKKIQYRLQTIFLVLLAFTSLGMSVDQVPNPRTTSGSFIQDSAQVLLPPHREFLDNVTRELEQKTGIEMALVTIDSLEGLTVDEYAVKLFERFGIGKKGKGNGVLILMAMKDRKIRIEVGYGLEGVLTDLYTGQVLDESAVPAFKESDYSWGLFRVMLDLTKKLEHTFEVKLDSATPEAAKNLTQEFPVEPSYPEEAMDIVVENEDGAPVAGYFILALITAFMGGLFRFIFRRVTGFRKERSLLGRKELISDAYLLLTIFIPAFIAGSVAYGLATEDASLAALLGGGGILMAVLGRYGFLSPLERSLKGYRVSCTSCGKIMHPVNSNEFAQRLTEEEKAEREAKGYEFELWDCRACSYKEKFQIKRLGASPCEKCQRRTLKINTKVITPATTSSSGSGTQIKDCRNPKCKFHEEKAITLPRKSSSSGSSGSSRSGGSSSSFGGGRSGGGGSSRGW